MHVHVEKYYHIVLTEQEATGMANTQIGATDGTEFQGLAQELYVLVYPKPDPRLKPETYATHHCKPE